MFAASLTSSSRPPWPSITLSLSLSLSPSLSSSTTTVKSCLSVAKFRRKSRSQNHDKDYMQSSQNEGVVGGQAVLTAFKSMPAQQQLSHPEARVVVKSQIEEQTETVERQLRGSDVLRAIQRASVEKANQSLKQKNNKRDISPPRMTSIKGKQMPLKNDYCTTTTTTTTNEPLYIKSEWGVRLEELEKRLCEIMLLE